jgi:WD40 repeat protein
MRGLLDVCYGRQSWVDYLNAQAPVARLLEPPPPLSDNLLTKSQTVTISLSASEQQRVAASGLGALAAFGRAEPNTALANLELSSEKLAGGLARLNADFNLLLGDLVWKYEMQHETLNNLLQEVRLAEFEREARAYRTRAERAYLNGWHEEALADFLEAAARNYPDYAVHRSIAHLYLYHLINLPKALEYFSKAAKYARPTDTRQAAEAHYFAGVVCVLQRQLADALAHMQQATQLDPQLAEAHYQQACLAALLGHEDKAITSLRCAINGDARYHERARDEEAFAALRPQVQALLEQLLQPVKAKVAEIKHEAAQLQGYVVVRPVEEKLADAFQQVERQLTGSLNYQTGLQALDTLAQLQQELRGLHDRYHKQHELDPRDYVRGVAFSNDGRLLAAGFLYGGLQVWEAGSGRQLYAHTAHAASVNSVAFSANNLWLASGSRDNTIKLWEADTGREVQILKGHQGEVSAVAFSPDGQWLVSASHDRTLKLWRVATGREAQTLDGHTMQVTAAAFTPDGETIISGSWDRTIKLWSLNSGRVSNTLIGHRKGVASLAVSPDGRWLAAGGEDARVKLWDLTSGREQHTFSGHGNSVTSVAFSPDGQLLAAGCLGQVVIVWKLATGAVVKRLKYDKISYNSVAFSPKGQWLALGSRDLQLWLKVILTEEEYALVRADELRASSVSEHTDKSVLPAYVPVQTRASK